MEGVTLERLIDWRGKHAFEWTAQAERDIGLFVAGLTMSERKVAAERAYAKSVYGDKYYQSLEFMGDTAVYYVCERDSDRYFMASGKWLPLMFQPREVRAEWYGKFGAQFAVDNRWCR